MSAAVGSVFHITGTVTANACNSPETNLLISSPPTALTFGNGASLSWENGVLKFVGPMDESAKLFFEHFVKPYVDSYVKGVMPHDNLKYLEWCAAHREQL